MTAFSWWTKAQVCGSTRCNSCITRCCFIYMITQENIIDAWQVILKDMGEIDRNQTTANSDPSAYLISILLCYRNILAYFILQRKFKMCLYIYIYTKISQDRLFCYAISKIRKVIKNDIHICWMHGWPSTKSHRAHFEKHVHICNTNGDFVTFVIYMMTSSNETFPRRWPFVWGIHQSPVKSHHKVSDTELWCFLWSASEQTVVQIIETPVIWEVLIMTSRYCTLWDLWDSSIERRSSYYLHAISTLWHYIDDNLNIVSSSLMCICAKMISLCFSGEKWHNTEIYFMFHKQYARTRLCFRSSQITQTWWALYEKRKSKMTFYLVD